MQSKARRPRPPLAWIAAVLGMVLAVTAGAYLLFFGWHQLSELQGWSVWSFGAAFAVVVGTATWLRVGLVGGVGATVSTTALFCIDAATTHDTGVDGGRHWAAAVLAVLIAAATGTCVVGAVVHAERLAYDRQRMAAPDARPTGLYGWLRSRGSQPPKKGPRIATR